MMSFFTQPPRLLSIEERDELFGRILQGDESIVQVNDLLEPYGYCEIPRNVMAAGGSYKKLGKGITATVYQL